MGDPTQIHQIIMNLGTNAEFAMRGTTGSLDVTLDEVDIDSLTADHTPGLEIGPYLQVSLRSLSGGIYTFLILKHSPDFLFFITDFQK